MFSTDRNIETLAQLFEKLLEYLKTEKLYLRLSIAEKLSRLVTALIVFLVVAILVVIAIIFGGTALAFALAPAIGTAWGFLVSAGIIIIILSLVLCLKKSLIEKPLVKLLSGILLEEDK